MAAKQVRHPAQKWTVPSFRSIEERRREIGMDGKELSRKAGLARGRYPIILEEFPDTNPYISTVRSLYDVVFSDDLYCLPSLEEMYDICGELGLCPRVICQSAGLHPRTFENDVSNNIDPHLDTYMNIMMEIIEADPDNHPDDTAHGINENENRISDVIGANDFTPEDLGMTPIGDR